MHLFSKTFESDPYAQLAPYYNRLMDSVDYDEWSLYIDLLFNRYCRKVTDVIDGGCGTGSLASGLFKLGYRVHGFDRSFEMLRNLKQKEPLLFFQGDLRAIPLKGKYDAFVCLYDTLQYLDLEEIGRVFTEVHGILKDGALFVFDLVTERHIKQYWRNYTERVPGRDWQVVRHSWYDPGKRCLNSEFDIYLKKAKKVYHELHVQHIFTIRQIEDLIASSVFRYRGKFEGYTFRAASEQSERIHFVLTKEDA